MFEEATRLKLRVQTQKGSLGVEDLWDLSLTQLNEVAKSLKRQLKASEEEDFLKEVSKENSTLELRFNIVLHILRTKQKEREEARDSAARKAEKQKVLEVLARKQDQALESLTEEQLREKLAAL